ncbi:hypothetical protein TNCV_3811591 [Trichonephila clavipes]|nr:hypothetical protein TNCV_3811591 [Trichonephila clavipes]
MLTDQKMPSSHLLNRDIYDEKTKSQPSRHCHSAICRRNSKQSRQTYLTQQSSRQTHLTQQSSRQTHLTQQSSRQTHLTQQQQLTQQHATAALAISTITFVCISNDSLVGVCAAVGSIYDISQQQSPD